MKKTQNRKRLLGQQVTVTNTRFVIYVKNFRISSLKIFGAGSGPFGQHADRRRLEGQNSEGPKCIGTMLPGVHESVPAGNAERDNHCQFAGTCNLWKTALDQSQSHITKTLRATLGQVAD